LRAKLPLAVISSVSLHGMAWYSMINLQISASVPLTVVLWRLRLGGPNGSIKKLFFGNGMIYNVSGWQRSV